MDKVWNKIDSRTLVYGGAWEDSQSTIRATVFGIMVDLAKDRIKHYRSDLYHDALWIGENLTGPMSFEWVVRESGTFIGEVVQYVKDDEWTNSARYRFDIRLNDSKWVLDIHEAGVPVGSHTCEECGITGAKFVDYMQMWLCSDFCTGKAENRLNQNLPTDIDYSENEAYQIQSEKEPVPYWGTEAAAPFVGSEEMGEEEQEVIPINDTVDLLFGGIFGETNFPTLRNESTRKENKMDDILRDLREKLDEANSTKDQLEEYQSSINDGVDEIDSYISDLDDLIASLDQLPEVSIYVDLDTVSFDS